MSCSSTIGCGSDNGKDCGDSTISETGSSTGSCSFVSPPDELSTTLSCVFFLVKWSRRVFCGADYGKRVEHLSNAMNLRTDLLAFGSL